MRSLAELVDEVERIVDEWSQPNEDWYLQPWFRGHGDARWKLAPTWYRQRRPSGIGAEYYEEPTLVGEFKLRARRYLDHVPASDWEWLFQMQHHGLPTRLLDWTESYLVAAYFAVRDHRGSNDVALWATNPWWINKQVFGDYSLFDADAPEAARWGVAVAAAELPAEPIAIRPVYSSARIQAQRGKFTIHGTDPAGLDVLAARTKGEVCLRKLTIPSASVQDLRLELARAGITESVVFPELDGLCRELKSFFFGS